MRASLPILTIAGAAGVWLAGVLLLLGFFGIHIA
jgi:hypothetical protein